VNSSSASISTDYGTITYGLVKAGRRTMAIMIRRDGSVELRVPYNTSDSAITAFIRSKAGWIMKHSERIAQRVSQQTKNYTDGEHHQYLGKNIPLIIRETNRNRISFSGDAIIIESSDKWNPEYGEHLLNGLFRKMAMNVFSERLGALLQKFSSYNFKPTGLKVRNSVSRWGSCSATGSITLSTNLVKKRIELIDYVILHELCHLRHRNHGPGFYSLLEELCPDYRTLKNELKHLV
jgi:predicted metal-dependent hydrolase